MSKMAGKAITLLCALALGTQHAFAGNSDPSQAPAICAAQGSDGILVAHEDCSKFYKCSEGKPAALDCPANLYYNPDKEYCDWSWNVDCQNKNIEVESDKAPESGSDNAGSGNSDPSEAPAICAAEGSDGILVAHEDCRNFYICSEGKPAVLSCPENLIYNPEKGYCDWSWNVNCQNKIIEVEKEQITENVNAPNSDKNAGNVNSNPSEAAAICAAQGSDGILIAHEDCSKFYKCSEGKPAALDCPLNLLYNPEKEYCDWSWNVDCQNRNVEDESAPGESSPESEPAPESDKNTGGGNSDPSEAAAICAEKGSDGILIAHEDCSKFYMCSEGKPAELSCPANLLYNPEKEYCDWSWNVVCKN